MPRQKSNPFPEGSAEYEECAALLAQEKADRAEMLAANPELVPTERNITVTVSIAAITAAKALAALSGLTYRQVLGEAARDGVESLTAKVKAALTMGDMPF